MPRCDCQSRFQAVKAPAGVPRDVAGAIIGRLDQNQMTFCAHPLGRTVIRHAPGGSDAALRKRTAAARATVSLRQRNGPGGVRPAPHSYRFLMMALTVIANVTAIISTSAQW